MASLEDDGDDAASLRRVAAGDMRALAPLYERHRGAVMTVLRQQTGVTGGELEDLCQEVFLTLREVASRFVPGASARSFLVGIAVRKAKKATVTRWLRQKLWARHAPKGEGAVAPHGRVEAGRDAERLLAQLPAEWRTVVLLNLVEGFTAEEIAEALGISPNTVFTRLHRARARLRELQQAQEPAP